jgi:hypothetical protein
MFWNAVASGSRGSLRSLQFDFHRLPGDLVNAYCRTDAAAAETPGVVRT